MRGSRAPAPKFPRVGIVAKTSSEAALRLASTLARALQRRRRQVLVDEATAEALRSRPKGIPRSRILRESSLIIVLGGDGSLLSVARAAPPETPST